MTTKNNRLFKRSERIWRDKNDYLYLGPVKLGRFIEARQTIQFQIKNPRDRVNGSPFVEISPQDFTDRITEALSITVDET